MWKVAILFSLGKFRSLERLEDCPRSQGTGRRLALSAFLAVVAVVYFVGELRAAVPQ